MAVQPVIDHGQELAKHEGQAIGFVDTKDQFDAVTNALKAAGYAESNIVALSMQPTPFDLQSRKCRRRSCSVRSSKSRTIGSAIRRFVVFTTARIIHVNDR